MIYYYNLLLLLLNVFQVEDRSSSGFDDR